MLLVRLLLLVLIEVMWIKGTVAAPNESESHTIGNIEEEVAAPNESESHTIGNMEEEVAAPNESESHTNGNAEEEVAAPNESHTIGNMEEEVAAPNESESHTIGNIEEEVAAPNESHTIGNMEEEVATPNESESHTIGNIEEELAQNHKEITEAIEAKAQFPEILVAKNEDKQSPEVISDNNTGAAIGFDVMVNELVDEAKEAYRKNEEILEISNVRGEKEMVSQGIVKSAHPLIIETDEKSHKIEELEKSDEENSRIELVNDEVHDSAKNNMDSLVAVFAAEIDGSVPRTFTYPDYAANEMIDRLEGENKMFQALRKKIHYLEDSMNNHKNAKLVDDKQVEDVQMILEIMDEKMLRPFSLTLEAIREEIIEMDHSLKGDTLNYVKGLVKRAENFINEAEEKLKTVVETDEEWTSYENINILAEVNNQKVFAQDIKKENEIPELEEEVHSESLNHPPTIVKSIKKDLVSKYENLDNPEKPNIDQIPSSKGIKKEFKNSDFVPTEETVVMLSTEDQNMLKVFAEDIKKENEIPELEEEVHNESLNHPPTVVKSLKKDEASKYENLENLEKPNTNDQIPSSKGIEEEIKNGDFVPTDATVVVINTEDQNIFNGLKDQIVAKKKIDEVTERQEDVIVDNDRKINPKIKLILETSDFLKNNKEQTHDHSFSKQENISWAASELMLPLLTLVVLSGAIIALIFSRIKKKQVISVNSLNSWGKDYGPLETVSTIQNPNYNNYYKLK